MNILWLTWKDHNHPEAGGAEVVARELTHRLIAEGHTVTLLTCGYAGVPRRETMDGVEIIRVGSNRYLHSFQALAYYLRHLRGRFDVLIEEVNAAPYFGVLFEKKARRFMLYHQLEQHVWFYETRPPLSHLGHYLLEPIATRLVSRSKAPVITISDSTKNELERFGFNAQQTHIISEGIEIEPVTTLEPIKKYNRPTLLSLGAMRAMKRTLDQVKAFELAKRRIPNLQLKIAGSAEGSYGQRVLAYIRQSQFAGDIRYLGKVSREKKIELMRRSHLISVTSVKEGWGLIVTEAASQGTPAIVYDVLGLRDSVRHNETGYITHPNPEALAEGIVHALQDKTAYERWRKHAWQWSQALTFDQSYRDFKQVVGLA